MDTIKPNRTKKLFFKIITSLIIVIIVGIGAYSGYSYLNNQRIIAQEKQATAARVAAQKAVAAAIEAKKKEPVYINLPGAKPVTALVDDYTLPSSIWALVSKTHAISIGYIPTSLKIPDVSTRTDKSDAERSVRSDIETPLKALFTAAADAGNDLMIGSGYRSAAQQKIYFDSYAQSVGEAAANQTIAYPGQSEHQTGLAVDVSTTARNCYLSECFADTTDGMWLVDNAYRFGFILRYPKGKEDITGYQYEPWHFRYVGVDLSTALHDSNLAFDEAWPYLNTALTTLKKNGAL